jgi:hypothetical protein
VGAESRRKGGWVEGNCAPFLQLSCPSSSHKHSYTPLSHFHFPLLQSSTPLTLNHFLSLSSTASSASFPVSPLFFGISRRSQHPQYSPLPRTAKSPPPSLGPLSILSDMCSARGRSWVAKRHQANFPPHTPPLPIASSQSSILPMAARDRHEYAAVFGLATAPRIGCESRGCESGVKSAVIQA